MPEASSPSVRMEGITKRFGPVLANDSLDLEVNRGEIHCLLGENGAGKSTLMRILYGLTPADSGRIYVDGSEVRIGSPQDAMKCGIGMVHQHFMLVDRMTVAENIVAGLEPRYRYRLLLDYKEAENRVKKLSETYGLRVDPSSKIEELSVGNQQRVEILKALYRRAEILILDEPTAVLTPQEVDELFRIMRSLSESGKTIIFITHKLRETMAISDRVTVLRHGRNIGTMATSSTSPGELAELMVGRKVHLVSNREAAARGGEEKQRQHSSEPVLELDNVWYQAGKRTLLKGISLQVRKGEILGIAGVEGNGQLELEELVAGLARPTGGSIRLFGADTAGLGPSELKARGVAHIPSDRHRRAIVSDFSIARNLILGAHRMPGFRGSGPVGKWFLDGKEIRKYARDVVSEFDVRCGSIDDEVSSLSGGNQQKLVIGRELSRDPGLIIAAQPTRGLDVGAIEYIHNRLLEMRAAGKAILLLSAELDEIMALSDRIAVIYEGRIVAMRPSRKFTERELGLFMAGHKEETIAV